MMRRMGLFVAFSIFAFSFHRAAFSGESAMDLYQQALVQMHAVGSLEEATKLFERAAKESGSDRALGARALLRASECYEQLGDFVNSAASAESVIKEYGDQHDPVNLARARMAKLAKHSIHWGFDGTATYSQDPRTPFVRTEGWGGASNGLPEILPTIVNEGCIESEHCIMFPRSTAAPPKGWYVYMVRRLDATPYINHKVRFRAAVRVGADPVGEARLWLSIGRGNNPGLNLSFYNDMRNSPIRSQGWTYHTLTGVVAPTTEWIDLGIATYGQVQVWFDDVTFEIAGPNDPVDANYASAE